MKPARIVTVLALALATASPAIAAEPDDVAEVVAEQGVYVEDGASATTAEISDLVTSLRNAGERASIVVLADEPVGGAVTFSEAVADSLGEDNLVLTIAPESYGFGGTASRFTQAELDDALDAVTGGETDAELARVVVVDLVGAEEAPAPGATTAPVVPGAPAASSGGGGFSIWPIIIIGGLLLLGWMWWRNRRGSTKEPRIDARLLEAKTAVQKQLDDVANDIIELEDDVQAAANPAATDAYTSAGRTYNEVFDLYPAADNPQALLDLANRLDEAIWQLDSTEAILDGKTPPPRPQPQALPPEVPVPDLEPAPSSVEPEAPGLPPRPDYGDGTATAPPPRPEYDRRDSRQSSYRGGSLLQILIGVGGMLAAGRRSSSRRGGSGGGGLGDLLGGLGAGRSGSTVRPPSPTYPRIDLDHPKASPPRPQGGTRVRTGRLRKRT